MTTTSTTTTTKLERFTITADVLLTLDVEAGSPGEALDAYRALRRTRPELRGRGGLTVLLPADSPVVVTTEVGRVVLRVDRVEGEGKPGRGHPWRKVGQGRNGNGEEKRGGR
jgi:hypothetical protein